MKGSLWDTLWLVVTVVVTLATIVLYYPLLGSVMDSALRLDQRFRVMEVSAGLSLVQASLPGFVYTYDGLPRRSLEACLRLHGSYVAVERTVGDVVQRPPWTLNLSTRSDEGERRKEPAEVIFINCRAEGTAPVFRRLADSIRVEVEG